MVIVLFTLRIMSFYRSTCTFIGLFKLFTYISATYLWRI